MRTLFAFLLLCSGGINLAAQTCNQPALQNQQRDAATIQRLEHAWSVAFMQGDADTMRCILSPDYMEITSDGNFRYFKDEIAGAEKHKSKPLPLTDIPTSQVMLHGDAAVGYGVITMQTPDGKKVKRVWADYYVWENKAWHAYFAQQASSNASD